MKRLIVFGLGLFAALVIARLLIEYLRPVRAEVVEKLVPVRAYRQPPSGERDVLNLNQADASALSGLPGVGPVLAERIVAHRQQIGRFTETDDLLQVQGIGPALMERLSSEVTV